MKPKLGCIKIQLVTIRHRRSRKS